MALYELPVAAAAILAIVGESFFSTPVLTLYK
jgi:hypothetical protein